MYKKLIWGLGVLALLICTAFVFMTVRNLTEMRQLETELAAAEKPLEALDKMDTPVADSVAEDQPPRPARAGYKWEWHDDHWHEMPAVQKADKQERTVPIKQVTAAQKAEWLQFWKEQGLDPPPKGHGYEFDGEGNATLFKYNEPSFITGWSDEQTPGQDFSKLTETEWNRYQALRHIVSGNLLYIEGEMLDLMHRGEPLPDAVYAPGVQELAKKWVIQLRQKASGSTPHVSTKISWNREPTQKELLAIERKEAELLKSMERPKRPFGKWQPFVESIVKELEAAVAAE